MRLFKALKFASLGVCIGGVLAAIQGCTLQQAGAALLVLLALMLPGLGGDEETAAKDLAATLETCVSGGTAVCAIDLYTDSATQLDICNGNNTPVVTDPAPGAVFGQRRLDDSSSSTDATGEITIGLGIVRFSNVSSFDCTIVVGRIIYPNGSAAAIDISGYTKLSYGVAVVSGTPPSGCSFSVVDGSGKATSTLLPLTQGIHTVMLAQGNDIGEGATDYKNIFRIIPINNCILFPAGAEWTMTPFILSP